MTTWNSLSPEVQAKIIAYYEKKLKTTGLTAVRNALTQQCFERAIDEVLDDVRTRKRRARADIANTYNPPDAEIAAEIQAKIDGMSVIQP